MPGWEELGMQTASNVANGVLGLALGGINDRRQLKQQEKLQNLQITGSKQLTDYNFQKQMEMWKNTNYPAQMAMLKQAGLNPALIYDHGGSQASTSVSTGNVSGASAPTGGGEAQTMIAMGLQRQMMQAQVELTKAQTQKTVAETGAVQPNIAKTQAETASIAQGIKNQEAQQRLTEIQSDIASVQSEVTGKTQNQQIAMYGTQLQKATQELEILKKQNKLTDIELRYSENRIKADIANKVMDTWLKNKEGENIDQGIKESVRKIQNMIQENMRQWDRLSIENTGSERDIQLDVQNEKLFPEELTDILKLIGLGTILKGGATNTPIRGFHNRN